LQQLANRKLLRDFTQQKRARRTSQLVEDNGKQIRSLDRCAEFCMTIDPVCGMEVDPKTSSNAEYDGETYYFCSEQCRLEFMQDPGQFIGLAA
jgi:YHS domain-containing protein